MPAILLGLLPLLGKALENVIPDPNARQAWITDFFSKLQQSDLAQIEVNKVEAQNASIFVAGWRPFIGWVGGAAIAFQFVIKPMILSFGGYFSEAFVTSVMNAPALDSNMWELITAMLGIGAMRSFEKIKGVAK